MKLNFFLIDESKNLFIITILPYTKLPSSYRKQVVRLYEVEISGPKFWRIIYKCNSNQIVNKEIEIDETITRFLAQYTAFFQLSQIYDTFDPSWYAPLSTGNLVSVSDYYSGGIYLRNLNFSIICKSA